MCCKGDREQGLHPSSVNSANRSEWFPDSEDSGTIDRTQDQRDVKAVLASNFRLTGLVFVRNEHSYSQHFFIPNC